ncbi:hypothetical protein B0H10DRAFT_2229819 [Mycena sp. CBHHK59/15]|nr:hypothetical protein B0H10DRAFT_2229819 [Mycena sp. CBHHK59/15]
MSVLVDGVWTSRVVISPLLPQTTLSIAFVSSGLGSTLPGPSSVTIAVNCGPIESLSIHLPCALSFDQQTAVSLGVDWITSVRKWYLDHGCELLGDAFSLAGTESPNSPTPGGCFHALPTSSGYSPTSGGQSPTSGGSIPSIRARWK